MEELINFGFINIDKSIGPTSFSISHFLKRELGLSKTSHLGTLDPNVGGVLPVALGRACKLSGFLIGHDKIYIGILETHKPQKMEELQKLIDEFFSGTITQTPPHKSAVKRAPRQRDVYEWKLLENLGDRDFLFIVKVEGGTYIRKLCSDLGEKIGGAHMAELRRIQAGVFDESKIYTLYEFQDAVREYREGKKEKLFSMIEPAAEIVQRNFIVINVKNDCVSELLKGRRLRLNSILNKGDFSKLKNGDFFAIFSDKNFVEIAVKAVEGDCASISKFVYN